jgi:small conductance mechanosensitive channel
LTLVGNGKVFTGNIENYTANPFRRVELKVQLPSSADHVAAMNLLREKLATVPNVLTQPSIEVEIIDFSMVGYVLAVRPFCHNDNYWQVYFDSNRTIIESLASAGFPAPMPP